jgi:chromosome segregation ATPase
MIPRPWEAEVVNLSEEVVLAKAAIERLTKALANSEADYFRLRDKAAQFRDEWQSLEGVVQRVREVPAPGGVG